MTGSTEELLRFDGLGVDYRTGRGKTFTAVDDVSFVVKRGETVGLIGESGSGKTTIGSTALGLAPVTRGRVSFKGEDISHARPKRRRQLSAELQVIFQDPYSSLNPSRTIAQTLVEPLLVHESLSRSESAARVREMLTKVGLGEDAALRYPGHFSGGQRQRIAIARALMLSPDLVICDEAVSALDLSVQAQVLNLLLTLQKDLGLSYLFISHDLSVVTHMCDRIVVLYHGRIMEVGTSESIRTDPQSDYTKRLLAASPIPDPEKQRLQREGLRAVSSAAPQMVASRPRSRI